MRLSLKLIAGVIWIFLTAAVASDDSSKWEDKLKVFGDFRTRLQGTDFAAGDDRLRVRIRFRLGATWSLSEALKVGARVVTGNPDNPRSTHQTLGEGFDDFDLSLDRAFVQYTRESLVVLLGKFGHPFEARMPYRELIWDADVQPEGVAAFEGNHFHAATGYYILNERFTESDQSAVVAQVGGWRKGNVPVTWDLAYYHYDADEQTSDLSANLFDLQSTIGFEVGGTKGELAVQVIRNTAAPSDRDTGFAVGLVFEDQGFIDKAYIQFQRIEEEAIFADLAQDGFPVAVDFKGFIVGFLHQIRKKIDLHLTVINTEPLLEEKSADLRFRFDFNIRF